MVLESPEAYRASERARARSDARAKCLTHANGVNRRVVGVARFLPNSPKPTRDTLELRLECGHRHTWQRAASGALSVSTEALRILGSHVVCSRCSTLARFRRGDERGKRGGSRGKFLQPRV